MGSKADAQRVKQDIGTFMKQQLHLTLSEEKTKVTHSSEKVRYLGYDISVSRSDDVSRDKNGTLRRMHYGRVRFPIPHEKWQGKLLELGAMRIKWDAGHGKEYWKPMHRGPLQNLEDIAILSAYNSEIRGVYNYYRLASDVSVLDCFYRIMKRSLYKTFAAKYRTTAHEIQRRYVKNNIFGVDYYTRKGPKRCELYHGGFKTTQTPLIGCVDRIPAYYYSPPRTNSLKARIKAGICELCGEHPVTIHMHHVRKLKALKGTTPCEARMLAMRRRSIALCPACYEQQKPSE